MEFEHIIEVNNMGYHDDDGTLLTADALWFGLMVRIEDPCRFLPGFQRCLITHREPRRAVRTLYSGQAVIHDEAEWEPQRWVRFTAHNERGETIGVHTIRILNSESGALALHFHYHTTGTPPSGTDDGIDYAAYLREAWRQADHDTVRIIRELAAAGDIAH